METINNDYILKKANQNIDTLDCPIITSNEESVLL